MFISHGPNTLREPDPTAILAIDFVLKTSHSMQLHLSLELLRRSESTYDCPPMFVRSAMNSSGDEKPRIRAMAGFAPETDPRE